MIQDASYIISLSLKKHLANRGKPYLSFLGSLPFTVILTDSDNIIRFCNHELLGISPFSPGEIIDSPVQKIFSLKDNQTSSEILILFKNRRKKTFERKLIGRKNKPVDVLVTVTSLEIADALKLSALFFQVFSERMIDPEISGLQAKLDSVQSLAHLGYWEIDEERSVFKGSEECFKLLGMEYLPEYINYKDLLGFLPRKEDRENLERGLIAIARTEYSFQTDIKIKKLQQENGETAILRLLAKWSGSEPHGKFKGIIQEITETKKIEKELLRAKEKAERADRLKSHFLTNLSHEIRTPMNAILGFAELLNLEDLTKEQKSDFAKVIRVKGNNLLSLIDDGIELSKFETGVVSINKSEFELYPLLKELFDEFDSRRIQLGKTSIGLDLKVPEEYQHDRIFTDPGRLQQMLSNLLSNAIKFTEKGIVEFGYKKSGKFFKFYVKDTGIGIEEEDQDHIFNRFHEIEETSTKKYGGSGLNLTISKHIVEILGGKIKVKSEINKGSRFQISIPVESPKRKKTDMTEFNDSQTVNWKDKVILIAEDEDVNFRFLEAVLQKTQTQILRAKTGKEAVELCKNIGKIDLVLMDIKMPEMNGFEATKIIKKMRPDLPVIAQTAFAAQDEQVRCQQAGCDDIITKPIDIKLLLRKLNDLLP